MSIPKLIILRGPSGSGKSTVANKLFERTKRRAVLIEQDYYRFIFKPAGGGGKANSSAIHKMIKTNTLIALEDGYDVILEGILSVKSYGEILEELFIAHPKENYIFYFDVSLEETLRRHALRRTAKHKFDENDMREWYPIAHNSGHRSEKVIPEQFSVEETLKFIEKAAQL